MGEFPNKATQFSKENQPANKSRKKGVENSKTRLKRLLELVKDERNPITGEFEEFSVMEIMDMKLVLKAMKGDLQAYREILGRLEGKATQKNETTLDGKLDVSQITGIEIK